MIDLPATPEALRNAVKAMQSPAWERDWQARLRGARDATLQSVRSTTEMMINLAAARHVAGDSAGFASWARFTLAHASGANWDATARLQKGNAHGIV